MSKHKRIYRIVLLGDGAVGKTALRHNYLGEVFKEDYGMTIGADFAVKRAIINDVEVIAQIWDLAGQPQFEVVRNTYYKGVAGAVMVYDITRKDTFENIPRWIQELVKNNDNKIVPLVLLANKNDLRGESGNEVPSEDGKKYSQDLSKWSSSEIPYIETSAKTSENVDYAFELLLKTLEARA